MFCGDLCSKPCATSSHTLRSLARGVVLKGPGVFKYRYIGFSADAKASDLVAGASDCDVMQGVAMEVIDAWLSWRRLFRHG